MTVRRSTGGGRPVRTAAAALAAVALGLGPSAHALPSADRAPSAPSSSSATGDWPQFHNTSDRVGVNTAETQLDQTSAPGLTLDWQYATGGAIWSSPVVANGVVYFGSDDKKVWALNLDGTKKWTYLTGDAVRSIPAVDGGVVYVGSNDNLVYALDAVAGTKKWSFAAGNDILTSAPLVANGMVYVGSLDGNFYALNKDTGVKNWSVNTWAVRGGASISGTTVYVGSDQSKLFALDANTGVTKWSATLGGRVRNTPAVAGGVVYVGADDGKLYAYDAATGVKKWSTLLSSNCSLVRSTPAIYNGKAYVVTGETCPMDGHIYAVNTTTGTVSCNHGLADYATSSVAVANGVAMVGTFGHQLYAFDTDDCTQLWDSGFDLMQAGLPSSPAISNGVVYVGNLDNSLYSFGVGSVPISSWVTIKDTGFDPKEIIGHELGTAVEWTNDGSNTHTVTDSTGMGFFDSGDITSGEIWTFTFDAACIYKYKDNKNVTHTGTVKAPMILTPATGNLQTVFTIQWATAPPPSGYVYDVQIRRPGSSVWSDWKSNVTTTSATFVADSGKGTYDFKAHVEKTSSGKSCDYSPFKSIVVS
jgi:eukaryotic-like serine/threonine-protein kinase